MISRNKHIVVLVFLTLCLLFSDAAMAIGPKKKIRHRRKAKTENVSEDDSIDWGTTIVLTDIKVHGKHEPDSTGAVSAENAPQKETLAETSSKKDDSQSKEKTSKGKRARSEDLSPTVDALLDEAMSHLGQKYVYGAAGPNTFDCSGFTSYCFSKIGIDIPRNSSAQFEFGEDLQFMDEIRPGDLVFFRGGKVASSIGHVGIVIEVENGGEDISFIHSSTSSGVMISKYTDQYYHVRYMGARRVIPKELEDKGKKNKR